MVKPTVLANAVTTTGLVGYVVCRVLALIAPDLLFALGQSWAHTFNLSAVRSTVPMNFGTFLLGGVTFGVLVWAVTYATASLYNRWLK